MEEEFLKFPKVMQKQQAAEIRCCNEYTAKFGVSLTDAEIQVLIENRKEALKNTGRIEFSNGILQKLIFEFCDTIYIPRGLC